MGICDKRFLCLGIFQHAANIKDNRTNRHGFAPQILPATIARINDTISSELVV
jgi:hypothetical protein